MNQSEILLSIKDLSVYFTVKNGINKVVRNCSLDLKKGEILSIVGESGSGKSVITKALVGMLDKNGYIASGNVFYHGEDIAQYKTEKKWRTIRGKKIAMVMQDPMTSLDPLMSIGKQIEEAIEINQHIKGKEAKKEAIAMLEKVGIQDPERKYYSYPHELSGGQRQRVVIAIACSCKPEILICDEPTTALDVTKQNQILDIIKQMRKEVGVSVIVITHDLGVVANIADRVAVMYAGEFVEIGLVKEIFYDSWHPYTWALLKAIPQKSIKGQPLPSIEGTPPNRYFDIQGDPFAPRNKEALEIDYFMQPPWFELSPTHKAKTWYLDPRCKCIKRPESVLQYIPSGDSTITNCDYTNNEKLIEVKDIEIAYGEGKNKHTAVKHASFSIYKGETFSIVGESGSGKSTIAKAIMNLLPCEKGDIYFKKERINGLLTKEQKTTLISKMQMIFQDPSSCLNDRAKVDYIVSEGLYNFKRYKDEEERKKKVLETLKLVGLQPKHASRFPHEFSGGQRQRIGIARAIIMEPEFIIADEPISALDVSIRAQVLNLLNDLKTSRNLTYLFIAHDLSIVRFISDRVAVIHRGRIVELAPTEEIYQNPLHPYTKSLLSSAPIPDPVLERKKKILEYNDDGSYENDKWTEVSPGHFVLIPSCQ